jgi:hypothetical protein
MARAAGFDKPYDLTDDQLTTVKGYLEKLKPNILKFAQQATDSVAAMVSGEAWLITGNLGNEDRVKDGGGPEIKGYVPKEGTVGWHDGEMIVKEGANKALIKPFLEQSQQAELIAENFLANGRPLFNEKDIRPAEGSGQAGPAETATSTARAPDVLPTMVLKGPGTSTEKSIPAVQRGLRRRLIVRHDCRSGHRGRRGPGDRQLTRTHRAAAGARAIRSFCAVARDPVLRTARGDVRLLVVDETNAISTSSPSGTWTTTRGSSRAAPTCVRWQRP